MGFVVEAIEYDNNDSDNNTDNTDNNTDNTDNDTDNDNNNNDNDDNTDSSSGLGIGWRMTSAEVRVVLGLRVDFHKQDILNLQL